MACGSSINFSLSHSQPEKKLFVPDFFVFRSFPGSIDGLYSYAKAFAFVLVTGHDY